MIKTLAQLKENNDGLYFNIGDIQYPVEKGRKGDLFLLKIDDNTDIVSFERGIFFYPSRKIKEDGTYIFRKEGNKLILNYPIKWMRKDKWIGLDEGSTILSYNSDTNEYTFHFGGKSITYPAVVDGESVRSKIIKALETQYFKKSTLSIEELPEILYHLSREEKGKYRILDLVPNLYGYLFYKSIFFMGAGWLTQKKKNKPTYTVGDIFNF